MTDISRDEVAQLARLSRLQLTEEETTDLQKDLANILDYVASLKELNTEGVEPTYQVNGLQDIWRDDVVVDDHVSREQLLALSSEAADHHIKVPKVL